MSSAAPGRPRREWTASNCNLWMSVRETLTYRSEPCLHVTLLLVDTESCTTRGQEGPRRVRCPVGAELRDEQLPVFGQECAGRPAKMHVHCQPTLRLELANKFLRAAKCRENHLFPTVRTRTFERFFGGAAHLDFNPRFVVMFASLLLHLNCP